MSSLPTSVLTSASRVLQERLPPGWTLESRAPHSNTPGLRITSKEGRSREVPVLVLLRADPREAQRISQERPLLVAAPYFSRSVQAALREAGASYVDATGNVHLVLDEPGLFVATSGADVNPWPEKRELTLRGIKAGRVVCALARATPPVGVRALAVEAGTDPGYVSRLLGMLDREAIVDRTRGRVERVDWRKLLSRWAEEAPIESRTTASTWLAARGLNSFFDALRDADFPYLVTGSAAGAEFAPVAPTRLASVYVEDPEGAAKALGLRATEAHANVLLLQPEDSALFSQVDVRDGLRAAKLPVIVADLLSGPGRSPAEADALMDWMAANEGIWRG